MPNQSTAKIDTNNKPTMLAWNDTTSAPEAIRVDPIFDYLEVDVVGTNSGVYTAINRAFIDGNNNATLLGWNDTTGKLEALRCDSNGALLVKFI